MMDFFKELGRKIDKKGDTRTKISQGMLGLPTAAAPTAHSRYAKFGNVNRKRKLHAGTKKRGDMTSPRLIARLCYAVLRVRTVAGLRAAGLTGSTMTGFGGTVPTDVPGMSNRFAPYDTDSIAGLPDGIP